MIEAFAVDCRTCIKNGSNQTSELPGDLIAKTAQDIHTDDQRNTQHSENSAYQLSPVECFVARHERRDEKDEDR